MKAFLVLTILAFIASASGTTFAVFNELVGGVCLVTFSPTDINIGVDTNNKIDDELLIYVYNLIQFANQGTGGKLNILAPTKGETLKSYLNKINFARFDPNIMQIPMPTVTHRFWEEAETKVESPLEVSSPQLCYMVPSVGSKWTKETIEKYIQENKGKVQVPNGIEHTDVLYHEEAENLVHSTHGYLFETFLGFLEVQKIGNAKEIREDKMKVRTLLSQIDSEQDETKKIALEKDLKTLETNLENDVNNLYKTIKDPQHENIKEAVDSFEAILSIFTAGDFIITCDLELEYNFAVGFMYDEVTALLGAGDLLFNNIQEALEGARLKKEFRTSIILNQGNGNFTFTDDDAQDYHEDMVAIIEKPSLLFVNVVKASHERKNITNHHVVNHAHVKAKHAKQAKK